MSGLTKCLCCTHYRVHEGCTVSCEVLGNIKMKSSCSSFEPDDYAQCYMSMTNHCAHCNKNYGDGSVECSVHGNIAYRERCYDFVEDYGCVEKKKGCFLTTATCQILGKEDDCDELETLRAFRDGYMQRKHPELIEEYYQISLPVVKKLIYHEAKERIAQKMMHQYIMKSVKLISQKRYEEAIAVYKEMVVYVRQMV